MEYNTSSSDIYVLGIVDFNTPHSKSVANLTKLASMLCLVNDDNPIRNASLALMPDLSLKSSERGSFDEDKAIVEALFGVKQFCDCKFIELFARGRGSDMKSNSRKWGEGRLTCNYEARVDNHWQARSELAVAGRPLGRAVYDSDASVPVAQLPRASELLQPAAPGDLIMSEKFSPSPEMRAAQKGIKRAEILIESALTNMNINGPLIIVNLTPYVHDFGAAVSWPATLSLGEG